MDNVQRRMLRVFDYVQDNLSGDLSVNTLAEVAHLSPYHFHRVFRQSLGETVSSLVRRIRLHWAAYQLISTSATVADIANRVGYSNVDSFARAFLRSYRMPPLGYREQYQNTKEQIVSACAPTDLYQVDQLTIECGYLIGLAHYGDCVKIGSTFEALSMLAQHYALTKRPRVFSIYYTSPQYDGFDCFNSVAAMLVEENEYVALRANTDTALKFMRLPAGRYASILHTGPHAELNSVYHWFYRHKLAQLNIERSKKPMFEEYIDNPKAVAPTELRTRVYWQIA